jgi:hypothetical protein
MAAKFLRACWPVLVLTACLFETETGTGRPSETEIRPDLSVGNQWMYRYRQYVENQNGSKGDTTGHFIHYEIAGDSLIAGIRYRLLAEEDLALFNTDYGLVKYRSAYALLSDSSGLEVKALKGGEPATGRFPFKSSAAPAFDTIHFLDEVTALRMPLIAGTGWSYRDPENPSGIWAAR